MNYQTPNSRQKFDFVRCTFASGNIGDNIYMKRLALFLMTISGLIISVVKLSPKQIQISGSVDITSDPEVVFQLISCVENYIDWNSLVTRDSSELLFFSDKECGSGAWVNWSGVTGPSVHLEIHDAVEPSSVEVLTYIDGDSIPQKTEWSLKRLSNGSTGLSYSHIEPVTPWFKRPFNLFRSRSVISLYNQSIENLNKFSQTASLKTKDYSIRIDTIAPFEFVGLRELVQPESVDVYIRQSFDSLRRISRLPDDSAFGYAGTIFRFPNEDMVDVTVFFRVFKSKYSDWKGVTGSLDLGKSIVLEYKGPLEGIEDAHYYARNYIKDSHQEWLNYCVEGYLFVPKNYNDTSILDFRIFYPLRD